MKCASGQIDINHASLSDLMSGFNVNLNRVVAQGIIDLRPWLQPQELDAVHGIDKGLLQRILVSNKACATPTSMPPLSADVCSTTTTIDVQAATIDELVGRLKLPMKTAQAVVAARPFSTLKLLNRDRFNGLPGVHTGFEAKLCLTPSPVRTATASYRWAYNSQTTTVRRGLFALSVPGGTIATSPGAWISVTDAVSPGAVLDGPTADFHIWTSWSDGAKAVQVTLPLNPDLAVVPAGSFVPAGVHFVSGGEPDFSTARAISVNNADGTLTFSVKTLSIITSTLLPSPLVLLPVIGPTFWATSVGRGQLLDRLVRWFLGLQGTQPDCKPQDITSDSLIRTTGTALNVDSVITRKPILHCVSKESDGEARWHFVNNTGAVLQVTPGDASAAKAIGTSSNGDDILSQFFFDIANGTNVNKPDTSVQPFIAVPPGGGVLVDMSQGSYFQPVGVGAQPLLELAAFVLRNLSTFVPIEAVASVLDVLKDCGLVTVAQNYLNGTQPAGLDVLNNMLHCTIDLVKAGIKNGGKVALKVVAEVLILLDADTALQDELKVDATGPYTLSLTYGSPPLPTPPGQPTDGNTVAPPIPGTGDLTSKYIVKVPDSPAAYVVDGSGFAHHIRTGFDYGCEADWLPVWYDAGPSRFAFLAPSGISPQDATCESHIPRSLSPANTPHFMLRGTDGTTYYINDSGNLVALFSGNKVFICMAQKYPIWDGVTNVEFIPFHFDPSEVATGCGF